MAYAVDGQRYEDRFDYLTSTTLASEEDQGREQVPLYRGGKNVTPKERPPVIPTAPDKGARSENEYGPSPFLDIGKYTPTTPTSKPQEGSPALKFWEHPSPRKVIPIREGNIDNDHHVPLVASAIMDQDGSMSGLAIDHRVKVPNEYLPHLALHEATELPLMHDYMADGMSEQDAYHKAHDIATSVESAAVRGYAARNGLDVDDYHEKYKQFFRDAAGTAREPSERERHPDAHTTRFALDEHELGHKPIQIDVLGGNVGIHSGPGAAKIQKDIETSGELAKSLPSVAKSMRKLDAALMKQKQYNEFLKRSKMHTKAGIDVRTQRPNEYLPANENMKDVTSPPRKPPEGVKYEDTDAGAMQKLYDTNKDMYKYYRAFFEQKGGKDWERWQDIEEDLGLTPYEGKPLPRFRTIKGGKE